MQLEKSNFLTIGPKASRRVAYWEQALLAKKYAHKLLSYKELLDQKFSQINQPTTLRITSSGEDFELKKQLMILGGCPQANHFSFEQGLIYPTRYWYQGWVKVLRQIDDFIQQNSFLYPINTPTAIQLAFHKLKCQQFLQSKKITTPTIYIKKLASYEVLMDFLLQQNIHQVFIKPYHGSSASGVMAFRQAKGKQLLYTTIHQKGGKLYNSLRLQKYQQPSIIRSILTTMIPSGLLVEEWIIKKQFQRKSTDLRVLVINGKAAFTVPRMSSHFITNLHLGNEKGNILAITESWGIATIKAAQQLAIQAVKNIDGLFYAGVDVAINNHNQPYILEVNAFGDLLLNIYANGQTTYEYELKEWMT